MSGPDPIRNTLSMNNKTESLGYFFSAQLNLTQVRNDQKMGRQTKKLQSYLNPPLDGNEKRVFFNELSFGNTIFKVCLFCKRALPSAQQIYQRSK